MKEIPLTQGKVALVSDEDYEFLNQWSWYLLSSSSLYAVRCQRKGEYATLKNKRLVYMHKVIAERAGLDVSELIDHRDRDSLNNQRYNLRPASKKQNSENISIPATNSSGCVGVVWRKDREKWAARIMHYGKTIYLGNFTKKEDAINARKQAEKKYYTHSEVCD